MIAIIGAICLLVGIFFVFVGCLGVYRFEDVYLRLQSSSKSLTMGLCFFLAGVALLTPGEQVYWKAALAIVFQFLTAPLAANVIAHAARRKGIKPVKVVQSQENEEG